MKQVIFACTQSASRSQIAASLFNVLCDPKKIRAVAIGAAPQPKVNPGLAHVMGEVGVELTMLRASVVAADLAGAETLLVTLGDDGTNSNISATEHLQWPLRDPIGKTRAEMISIREEIKAKIIRLAKTRGWLADEFS